MLPYLLMGRERSLSCTVHEPPTKPADRIARAEQMQFVRDGFSWRAFFLAPAWFADCKIWLGLAGYLGVVVLLTSAWWLFDLPWQILALLILALHALVGSEADELARAQLAARGWTTVGHVTGSSALDCERRFFDSWLPQAPMRLEEPVTAKAPPQVPRPEPAATKSSPLGQRILGNLLAPRHRSPS